MQATAMFACSVTTCLLVCCCKDWPIRQRQLDLFAMHTAQHDRHAAYACMLPAQARILLQATMAESIANITGGTTKRKICGHCKEFLTLPVYKRHKKLFYNIQFKRWNQQDSSGEESEVETDVLNELETEIDFDIPGINFDNNTVVCMHLHFFLNRVPWAWSSCYWIWWWQWCCTKFGWWTWVLGRRLSRRGLWGFTAP